MPRKKSSSSPSIFSIGITDVISVIKDAKYVVKWNIPLAMSWMSEAAMRVSASREINEYNYSAKEINDFLDILENMKYYNKQEMWGLLPPCRIELLTYAFAGDN
jgi:hypothetical protein